MCLQTSANGVLLSVHAHAGGRRNAFTGFHAGALKLETTAAPEKGKANRAFCKFIAKNWGIPLSNIHLQSGETSREKVFLITGTPMEELQARIAEIQRNC